MDLLRKNKKQIAKILAMPASDEYNRIHKLVILCNGKDFEPLRKIMLDNEAVTEITFDEFCSCTCINAKDCAKKAVEKLLNYENWYNDNLTKWIYCVNHIGINNMVNLFPYELWEGKKVNMFLILEGYFSKTSFNMTKGNITSVINFFSDKRNFQSYFGLAEKNAAFEKILNPSELVKGKYLNLFGNNFDENTLEREFELELIYFIKGKDAWFSLVDTFGENRIIKFFERNELDREMIRELSEKKTHLLEHYVRLHYIPSKLFAELSETFPEIAFANYMENSNILALCRKKGIAAVFSILPKFDGYILRNGLINFVNILAAQINCEVKPEYWKPILHKIDAYIYAKVLKNEELLQNLIDAGFKTSEKFLKDVETCIREERDSMIDPC